MDHIKAMNILLTGFEPFGGDSINPSADLAAALAQGQTAIRHVILPCAFAPLEAALRAAIETHQPTLLIGFGLATGRAAISLERVAINMIDARIPDNLGAAPIDQPILPDGPAAYFSQLPIKACHAELANAGIPAEISQTAGTYVCNAAFFLARHLAYTAYPGLRTGFVHIPCRDDMPAAQQGAPTLDAATLNRAGRIIIKTCHENHTDRGIAGGAIA